MPDDFFEALDKPSFIIYRDESCSGCAVKKECTRGPSLCEGRLYTVEPVLGDMKWNRRRMMNLRGVEKVQGEFLLMCLVNNIKKIVKRVLEGSLLWFGWHKHKAPQVSLS